MQVRLERLGTTSLTFRFAVRAGTRPVATGRTVYVTVATDGSGKVPVPPVVVAAVGTPDPAGPAAQASSR